MVIARHEKVDCTGDHCREDCAFVTGIVCTCSLFSATPTNHECSQHCESQLQSQAVSRRHATQCQQILQHMTTATLLTTNRKAPHQEHAYND
jgi:hypothetical protein